MKKIFNKLTETGRDALKVAAVAATVALGATVMPSPDTHSSGTVEIANPDVNLEGQGTSGHKAFDAAVNEVNHAVAEGREDGLRLNISPEEVDLAATMLVPDVRALDQNPDPNQVDIVGSKLVANFADGEITSIGFRPDAKQ